MAILRKLVYARQPVANLAELDCVLLEFAALSAFVGC